MASPPATTRLDIKSTNRRASREPLKANTITIKVAIAANTIGAIF